MTLADIFSKLPISVAFVLERQLDAIQLPVTPTEDEVVTAATEAKERTRTELINLGAANEEVLSVLDHVPAATVKHLFG